jgi:hypothetical protein
VGDTIESLGDAASSVLQSLTASGVVGTPQAQAAAQQTVAKQAGVSLSGVTLPGSTTSISWTTILLIAGGIILMVVLFKK